MNFANVYVALVGATLVCVSVTGVAAATPDASLSADLARYYFASPAEEAAGRAELNSALTRLESFRSGFRGAPDLRNALEAYEKILRLSHRHQDYLHVRCSRDRRDPACQAENQLAADVDSRTALLRSQVLAIPEAKLRAWCAADKGLAVYRFALDDIRRDGAHVLPGAEQSVLDRFRPQIADWQYALYDEIVAGISFGTVQTSTGAADVMRERTLLAMNPDSHVREEAFKRRFDGFASRRDLLAFALLHTVEAQSALAKAARYEDAPSGKYLSLRLDPKAVRELLAAMAREGDVVKRFERIRARDFERSYHAETHAWDALVPEPGLAPTAVPLSEVPQLFHEVFAGLGPQYQSTFDALLSPANARVDVASGVVPNRYTGGFSIGFPGSTSMLYVGRYDGTFARISTIAHEGGHATHRALLAGHDVMGVYAYGPSYMSESFAIFNELLLADYLAEHTTDRRLQRFYREQWLGIKGLDTFLGAKDALLEQRIYDGVSAGVIKGADDLDRLTLEVDGQFSIYPATTPQLRNRWASMGLLFEDPLYYINYVYGGLLALRYYQLYTADREHFAPRYVALLENGFDAAPADLLKRFLGIDLFDPALLSDALAVVNQRMATLETDVGN